MRRAIAILGLVGITGAGLGFSTLPTTRVAANNMPETTFLIPASEGYGVAECLSSRSECGRIVATAFCESKGFGKALAYGIVEKEMMTGSVQPVDRTGARAEPPLSITCAN
jgi:hypothetical protein